MISIKKLCPTFSRIKNLTHLGQSCGQCVSNPSVPLVFLKKFVNTEIQIIPHRGNQRFWRICQMLVTVWSLWSMWSMGRGVRVVHVVNDTGHNMVDWLHICLCLWFKVIYSKNILAWFCVSLLCVLCELCWKNQLRTNVVATESESFNFWFSNFHNNRRAPSDAITTKQKPKVWSDLTNLYL